MGASADAPDVIGRDSELGLARTALADGNVLLLGEPGIGKTTLWKALVDELVAMGADVLIANPAEVERDFSYAVLADLCESCTNDVGSLPPPQRRALEQALLLTDCDSAVDPHLVSVAIRTILRSRATSRRVFVAIDDVQWADEVSLAALSFALRRSPEIGLLASGRLGVPLDLPVDAARVELAGLSPGATHHLIVQRLGHSLPRPTLLRLHEISGGNPFFALELARVARDNGEPMLPDSLRTLLAGRVAVLSPATRTVLAKAALGGIWDGDFDDAIVAGLVTAKPPAFTHPLYAEAVLDQISESTQRRLHRELAVAADTATQRANHLAQSVSGTDAEIAAELDAAAAAATRRGALLASAKLWRRAAELTPAPDFARRAVRLVEHGVALLLAGSPDEANDVLTENLPLLPNGALRHRGRIHQALMLARTDSRAVIPVLEGVLAEVRDPHVRHEIIALLVAFHTTIGRSDQARALVDNHLVWARHHAPEVLGPALLMAASRETLDDRSSWELLAQAERATAVDRDAPRPAWGWALRAPALMREDRWDEARSAIDEAQQVDPAATVYQEASQSLSLTMVALAAGDVTQALERADEILCIGEQIQAPYLICQGHIALAEASTLSGDEETARLHIKSGLAAAEAAHAVLYVDAAWNALGLLSLGIGDLAAASAAFEAVTDDGYMHFGAVAGGRHQVDAIEALTALGPHERAAWIAETIPHGVWEYDAAQAMLSAANGNLAAALDQLSATPSPWSPFRRGRLLLLEGRWHRMLRQRTAARDALLAARGHFAAIGAPLWVARVDDELGRLGGRRPVGDALTESERRVADLVASGLSNKEVAKQLVVSQRTVEVHLTKIYAKLGVASRTGLVVRWSKS